MLWPVALAAFLLAMRTTGKAAAAKPSSEPRRRRRRRRRKRKKKPAIRRRKKTTPAVKLPDPLKDLFGPHTVPKPKAKPKRRRKRRRRPPPKPAEPTPKRRRRRRRVVKPIPPTVRVADTKSKPVVPPKRRPTVAEQFLSDLRAGELDRNGVAKAQRAMGGLDPDGIGGGKTMGKTEALLKRSVDWSDITWPRTPAIPKPPSAKTAARELWDYVHIYKGKRRTRIRMYQRTMGMSSTPGRIGPATRAKVMELTELEL